MSARRVDRPADPIVEPFQARDVPVASEPRVDPDEGRDPGAVPVEAR